MSTETTWIVAILVAACVAGMIAIVAYRRNEKRYAEVRIDIRAAEETMRLSDKPIKIHFPIGY